MEWSVTTPPTANALTWDQLRTHIKPGSVSDQGLILDYLASATAYAETKLQCLLSPQTVTATYDIRDIGDIWSLYDWRNLAECQDIHSHALTLPRGPVLSITSFEDVNGSAIAYRRHTAGNEEMIVPTVVIDPSQAPVTIVYQAGFETIPADIVNAIRIHVASLYKDRENTSNLPSNAVHKIDDFYSFAGRQQYFS